MVARYIVSATALLVVNNTILPGVIAWLLPTFVADPVIVTWTGKYKLPSAKGHPITID